MLHTKRIKLIFLAVILIAFCGCGEDPVSAKDMVKCAWLQKGEQGYNCTLYNNSESPIAQGVGQSIEECWHNTSGQIEDPRAYSMMDTVFVSDELYAQEILAFGKVLKASNYRFPEIFFYAVDDTAAYSEASSLVPERKKESACTLIRVLLSEKEGMVIPGIMERASAVVYPAADASIKLEGIQAELAKLIVKESRSIEAVIPVGKKESYDLSVGWINNSAWMENGWYFLRWDCFGVRLENAKTGQKANERTKRAVQNIIAAEMKEMCAMPALAGDGVWMLQESCKVKSPEELPDNQKLRPQFYLHF